MSTNHFSRFIAALPGLILAILRYILTLGWIREIVQLILANWDVKRRGEYLREVRRGRPLQCADGGGRPAALWQARTRL